MPSPNGRYFMNTHLLTNAQIVTPTAHFTGSIHIENGLITGIHKDKYYKQGLDLKGKWLIPGCIDIHTDYLEKELHPRSSAAFPVPFALHFLDARAAACGISTVFSAVSFSDNEDKGRSFEESIRLARQVDQVRSSMLVRHFLHARIDPNTDTLLQYLPEMAQLESLQMVVYNENIPGERQYSLNQQIEMRMREYGLTWEEARDRLMAQIQEAREINHRDLIRQAFSGKAVIGSHDDTTVAHILEARDSGAVLAEMPTTIAAARKAKEFGMWVCMGAPNYFRGGSHCGNLSCFQAMEEDLVDILCSDYHFPTVLASVVRMIDEGTAPSKAVNMVTLNPARLLGFDQEIGSIAPGRKADLVAFSSERSFASVSHVWVDGVRKLVADYALQTPSRLISDTV